MTEADPYLITTSKGRHAWWTALTGNLEHWGGRLPLLSRMMRYFGGDPAINIAVSSANSTTVAQLPDHPYVEQALLYVSDNSLFYRLDGTNPVVNADFYVPQGSYIRLDGLPTIKGFRFISAGGTACNLFGTYFD